MVLKLPSNTSSITPCLFFPWLLSLHTQHLAFSISQHLSQSLFPAPSPNPNPMFPLQTPQSPSLSKNLGSLLTLPSNFLHHSSNAFNGTTSTPVPPTFPLKLAKKLNAFLMILCARTTVSTFVPPCPPRSIGTKACAGDVGFVVEECKAAICDATESADSRDMPSVMSPPPPGLSSGASISTSPFCTPPALEADKPLILNIALSFPGPIPPRNLNCAC